MPPGARLPGPGVRWSADRSSTTEGRALCTGLCTRHHATSRAERDTRARDGDTGPGISRGHHGSQRLAGTPETGVVVLITQRSQVQILPPLPLPPLPIRRSEASSDSGRGLFAVACARDSCAWPWSPRNRNLTAHKPFPHLAGIAVPETSRHDLRLCGTCGTILLALLGAWPRGRRRIQFPRRARPVLSAERIRPSRVSGMRRGPAASAPPGLAQRCRDLRPGCGCRSPAAASRAGCPARGCGRSPHRRRSARRA